MPLGYQGSIHLERPGFSRGVCMLRFYTLVQALCRCVPTTRERQVSGMVRHDLPERGSALPVKEDQQC